MAIIPCDNYNELTVDRCITRAVDALGGVDAFVPPKAQVVLKPNLCLAEPFDKHVTTGGEKYYEAFCNEECRYCDWR